MLISCYPSIDKLVDRAHIKIKYIKEGIGDQRNYTFVLGTGRPSRELLAGKEYWIEQ